MQVLRIGGGRKLRGTVEVQGAKNAALPCLAAALLCDGESSLDNVPQTRDLRTMRRVIELAGATVKGDDHRLAITGRVSESELPYELIREMRASALLLGPLLARSGQARIPLPGGCAIGDRPIDMHLQVLERLGADVQIKNGVIDARARRLAGAELYLDFPSVGATQTALLAGALARGRTLIENAAREPEVDELVRVLNKMGARIHGGGTSLIVIDGVQGLFPYTHTLMADRIEAGTWLAAAALTRGDILVRGCRPEHLDATVQKLRAAGVEIEGEGAGLRARRKKGLLPLRIRTGPYPGFPTDLQPIFTALCTLAEGTSMLHEHVFRGRFTHVAEMRRLGAKIDRDGPSILVHGTHRLQGAPLEATDLRQAVALTLLALAADGHSELYGAEHIERGHADFLGNLRSLGGEVERAGG